MLKIQHVIAYISAQYSEMNLQLSAQRLMWIVYLADWSAALHRNETLTGATWVFDHRGPYSDEVTQAYSRKSVFEVESDSSQATHRTTIKYVGAIEHVSLDATELDILNHLIALAKIRFDALTDIVYRSYPVSAPTRRATLDLVALAAEYKASQVEAPHV
ncbi:MAG: Panacea domain-containing protein [Hafnia sp.]